MAIQLTESALKRVRSFMDQRADAVGVRVGVKTTGCSGMSYVVEIVDAVDPGDVVFEDQGVKVLVNERSLPYLDGTLLDYGKEGLNEGFRFSNPNAASTCGCGESFSL